MTLSRRAILQSSIAGAATLGLPIFTARQVIAAQPGQMIALAGTPNPQGGLDQLYWLSGDALGQPIRSIAATEGKALPASGLAVGQRHVLRLFHINDLHNHLTLPHKAKGDTHKFTQMMQRILPARQAAGAGETVLFFSAGDDHTGAIYDELVGWNEGEFVVDPAYRTYSAAGIDAAAMGNHELDRGAAVLRKGIQADARFPILSANLTGSRHLAAGRDYFPAAIALTKGLRIGLVGLTTPIDTHTGTTEDPGLAVGNPLTAIAHLLPALASVTDAVIILSHLGYGEASGRSGKAGAERDLGAGDIELARAAAKAAPGHPVLIIGGHTHTVLNAAGLEPKNLVDGIAILQAGGHGSHLGEAVWTIEKTAQGSRAEAPQARLHPIKGRDDRVKADHADFAKFEHDGDFDAGFETRTVAPLLGLLAGKLAEQIGQIEENPAVTTAQVVAQRYVGECALANFMNDALIERSSTFPGGRVDVALFNATGLAAGIPANGPLTFQAWYDVMPFADSILVFELTGPEVKAMLDSNAKRIVRPTELTGDNAVKLDGYVSRGFLHFSSGLRYRIRLGDGVAAAEATDITIAGQALDLTGGKRYRVAFNSYVAAGAYGEAWNGKPIGGGVPGGVIGYDVTKLARHDTGLVYRNEIIAHIRSTRLVAAAAARLDGRLQVG